MNTQVVANKRGNQRAATRTDTPRPTLPAAVWLLAGLAGLGLPWLSTAGGASLHVDEAQYWAWSQALAWGYYSKPPGIAALLAVSTTLFGDSESGVRALAQACYPATALVLAWLAQAWRLQAGHPLPQAQRSAMWAAALFLASPFTQWLGLVATTDAPLLLCWATAMASLWAAVVQRRSAAWAVLALAVAAGLLTKYAFAAWLPGAVLFVAVHGAPRDRWRLAMALAVAALACVPHGLWNQAQGWPTLRHTAEITLQRQHGPGESLAAAAAAGLAYGLAQALLLAPLLLPLLWQCWQRLRRRPPVPTAEASAFNGRLKSHSNFVHAAVRKCLAPGPTLCWASATPLAAAGVLQAARGGAELNWVAPAHLSLLLALAVALAGLRMAAQRHHARWLAAQALLLALLPLGASLAGWWGHAWPDSADLWARMRGWQPALQQLQAAMPAEDAQRPWVASQRTPLAQAMYHLRQHGHRYAMWQGPGPAATHHAQVCRWQPTAPGAETVLVLSEGPPEAGLLAAAGTATPVARVGWRTATGRLLDLRLTRLETRPEVAAVQTPASASDSTLAAPRGHTTPWCR